MRWPAFTNPLLGYIQFMSVIGTHQHEAHLLGSTAVGVRISGVHGIALRLGHFFARDYQMLAVQPVMGQFFSGIGFENCRDDAQSQIELQLRAQRGSAVRNRRLSYVLCFSSREIA